LFVVDRIGAAQPVRTVWNWLLNNRDGQSQIEVNAHTLTLRRDLAGLKLTHGADGRLHGPIYAMVHDAYHPEPARPGEGHSGSGLLYRWIEPEARRTRITTHALAVDTAALIDRWSAAPAGDACSLAHGQNQWTLKIVRESPLELLIDGARAESSWRVIERSGEFELLRDKGTST
jgi:hypothetical protein